MEIRPQSHPSQSSFVSTVLRPGVMISNAWPQSRNTAGSTARAIAAVLERHPIFECYQTVDVPTSEERREIRDLLGDRGIPLTYTLTRILGERGLNLSSLDSVNRSAACAAIIEQIDAAAEAGASTVCIISGPRPDDANARAEALEALEDSLTRICTAARVHASGMEIVIEPLDYDAHKKNSLGTTAEALGICRRLEGRGLELNLCIDSAHVCLNGEDVPQSVRLAGKHAAEFHFCNCCLDRSNPMFGDRHLPFGAPGVVDVPRIGIWLNELQAQGYLRSDHRPRVFCEVWKPGDMDSMAVVDHCAKALLDGWNHARTLNA